VPRKALSAVTPAPAATGQVELVVDQQHFQRVVRQGILQARVSLDIATADFKAMLIPLDGKRCQDDFRPGAVPSPRTGRRKIILTPFPGRRGDAVSIVQVLRDLAKRGVEIRLLHAGVPSSADLRELRQALPRGLTIRRCPRLHAKAVIVDCQAMYLGSANLTGAGLGAKADGRRNFELGVWTHATALIDRVLEQFNGLWEGRRCDDCRRRQVCPVPLEEPAL
jgi:phosphatidylserine/phosphatidylglycerophosphate/cardiolipin synthase-like enzyme